MLPIVRIRRKYTTNPSAVATRAFTSKAASEAVEGAEFSGASTKKQSGTSTTAAAVNVPAAAISRSVATRAFTSKAASEAVEGAEFSGASTKKQSGTSTTAAAVNVPAAAIS